MCEWILFRKLWKRTIKKGPYFCRAAALRGLFGVHFFGFTSRELSDIRRQRRFINIAFYRMLCKSDQMGCGKVGALECYFKRTTRVSLKRFFTMIKTQTWCPKAMLSKYFLLEFQVPHNISSQIGEDKIFRKTQKKPCCKKCNSQTRCIKKYDPILFVPIIPLTHSKNPWNVERVAVDLQKRYGFCALNWNWIFPFKNRRNKNKAI